MKTGFIGAGRVGCSLGKLFTMYPSTDISVAGYYSQNEKSAEWAAAFTNTHLYTSLEELIKDCEILFLTVPDNQIKPVYEKLVSYGVSEKIICHTSGAMSYSEAFPGIGRYNSFGYSVHPLFPVSDKEKSYLGLKDAFFCIEGDAKYIPFFKQQFETMGINVLSIASEDKVKYHMACATASNLVCGLISQAVTLLNECGFSDDMALDALAPLIRSNTRHILEDGCVNALTGPAERADVITVEKHIKCLEDRGKLNDLLLYKKATEKCIEIAKEKNPGRDYSKLEEILKEE